MDTESPDLLKQLNDPSKARRASAADSLGNFEYFDPRFTNPLIAASADVEPEVRVAAVKALGRLWRTLNGLLSDDGTNESDSDQFFELVNRALKQRLDDEDKYVRTEAAEALRDLYCSDQEVFDVFVDAASDEDESLRNRAAVAFWLGSSDTSGPLWQVRSDRGLAVLARLLDDNSEHVRNNALNAIRSVGLTEKVTEPRLSEALLKLLSNQDEEVKFKAALALTSINGASPAALPILINSLTDHEVTKRKTAAFALRKMGAEAAPAIPALVNGLKDAEVKVRTRCALALGQFGAAAGDLAIEALLEAELNAEQTGDRETNSAARRALTAIGKEHVAAVQSRIAARKSRDFFPLFGFKPEEIPFWMLMLWDPDANQRARAVNALGYLAAAEAIPELRRLLNDEDEDVRQRAANVLDRLGEQA